MAAKEQLNLDILVVDDEPLVCDAIKMLLKFDGHNPVTAKDAAHALQIFIPGKYHLVVLDYEMPGMKGDQLAAAIKERSPAQPIIMLTAHGDMLRSSGKPLTGVDLILDKPFHLDTLRAGIQQVMAGKK